MNQVALQLGPPPERIEAPPIGWFLSDLSDFELRLVLDFAPVTFTRKFGKRKGETYTILPVFSWKRGHQVTVIKGRGSIGLTTEAKQWAKLAAAQLRAQWSAVFREPLPLHANGERLELNAAIVSYLPTRRLTDASNLYQGVEDVLQAHQPKCKPKCNRHACALEDDVAIRTHDGSDRHYDPAAPRVEITMIPYWRRRDALKRRST